MMIYRKFWLAVLVIFSLAACENNNEDIDLMLPAHEEELIVEFFLEPGENYRALVTRTMAYQDVEETRMVDSVKLSLFTEGVEKEMLNVQTADTSYNTLYNYWFPEKVRYEEGKEFQLSVSYGDELRASGKTRFLPKAIIKDTYFKFDKEADSLAAIFIEIEDDPEEKNYYRVVVRGSNPSAGYTYEGLWDDADASGGVVTAYSSFNLLERWAVVVNVYHLEEQYYKFLKSIAQARESNYNPFMQPSSIQSSLDGATGIFTAITLTSDTIQVER